MATTISGLEILGPIKPGYEEILTPEAMAFLAELEGRFGGERERLLGVRVQRQALLDRGEKPDFLPETAAIRAADWTIAPLPLDLRDRRVEITGPVDRKMVINALNSGAKVFMADFEDANCPSWTNQMDGQINLRDAVRGTITYEEPASGKKYRLSDTTAVLKVRPRGWHLEEKHVLMEGRPISGGLFDFGLYFFHNAKALLDKGSGPYFYLPKMESHFEARLWNEVFTVAEEYVGLPHGVIRATVLIETILAAFEMDEILYELRDHSAGLNCGRWDYIFSFIKKFRKDPAAVMPDRSEVTMATHFLSSYSQLAIRTCHRRNAPAIGGMAAFIPVKNDPAANEVAFSRVRADKEREASNGHDGTWVAHPGLVPVAMEVFDAYMPGPNQIERKRTDVTVTATDLLAVPQGPKTEKGLRNNVAVGIGYIEAWLRGLGCVPLFNLMEDAATAEISRAQVWQWVHTGSALDDGQPVTMELVDRVIAEELEGWRARVGEAAYAGGRYAEAAALFRDLVGREDFVEFLTLPAYDRIVGEGA
ncbi:malate synthase A [Azospirillum thermophilum]|uniref:Malate synthase n=1 Tax=Azospirillum thermophilum TaxID=2202148 RepID=A0A2S2CPL6_9PROT|nr:malate synthase A [Azospirillum thermophilum]AWK86310.1 malate synthase A [Azospirillum thermophilum]